MDAHVSRAVYERTYVRARQVCMSVCSVCMTYIDHMHLRVYVHMYINTRTCIFGTGTWMYA